MPGCQNKCSAHEKLQYIVMVKILIMLEICSSQYSVKLFGIGTLCFKNMNNLKIVEKQKQQLTISGHFFFLFLFFMHSQRSQKYFLSLTLLPYWNSLKIKEYYYNGGHKAVQKGRLPTLSFSSRHLYVFSQPLQVTNYKIAPLYSGLIFYMVPLYDAITYDYG